MGEVRIIKIGPMEVIVAHYCPICGKKICPKMLHICGQFDVWIKES